MQCPDPDPFRATQVIMALASVNQIANEPLALIANPAGGVKLWASWWVAPKRPGLTIRLRQLF